jgi:hypothetical protein
MSNPTKMQMDVLMAASAHPDGTIILPPRLKGAAARTFTTALIDQGYARDAANTGIVSQEASDGHGRWTSPLVITMIARRMIECEAVNPESATAASDPAPAAAIPVTAKADASLCPRPSSERTCRPTKQSLILDLLARPNGASLDELVGATGWLAHTMRAALVRLRQKGLRIERAQSEDKISRYRLVVVLSTSSAA